MSRSFPATKRTSKDTGDGMMTLNWDCNPADLPAEFRYAPVKSPFSITVTRPSDNSQAAPEVVHCVGLRLPLSDRGDGSVTVKIATVSGTVPDAIVYAKNGASFELDITPADDIAAATLPLTPEERAKTLRTLMVMIGDPGFIRWLDATDDARLIQTTENQKPSYVETAVIEVVLRKIHANSRSDILHSALISERAERLLRAYRETTWKNRS